MSCTFATWALYDLEDDEPGPNEKPKTSEDERREYAKIKKRKEEIRKTRKETLTKTERVKPAVPVLMYSALGMFVCGVVAKLGSLMWIGPA